MPCHWPEAASPSTGPSHRGKSWRHQPSVTARWSTMSRQGFAPLASWKVARSAAEVPREEHWHWDSAAAGLCAADSRGALQGSWGFWGWGWALGKAWEQIAWGSRLSPFLARKCGSVRTSSGKSRGREGQRPPGSLWALGWGCCSRHPPDPEPTAQKGWSLPALGSGYLGLKLELAWAAASQDASQHALPRLDVAFLVALGYPRPPGTSAGVSASMSSTPT
mmetsp:Transcript_64953/g.152013  ORF Transcript_64953/g.152013 Transcript_64953/m.152013 type:complete len:221 (-) Transcript_64953:160-822(-)